MAKNTKTRLHLDFAALPVDMEREFNEMDARGWQLESYWRNHATYRRGTPNEYEYRVQIVKEAAFSEKLAYAESLKEFGIEFVSEHRNRLIFRKKRDGTPFRLFSDLDSQLAQARLIRKNIIFQTVILTWWALHRAERLIERFGAGSFDALLLALDLLIIAAAVKVWRNLLHAQRWVKELERARSIEE